MRIVVTGAAGIVGRAIRPYLAPEFDELVLLRHRTPIEDLADNEAVVAGDIEEEGFVDSLLAGADGLVHLAGLVGPDYTFDEVLGPNVVATHALFCAAVRHNLRQVVYASSHHAVGFWRRGTKIDDRTPLRADSYYGLSKAFGEVLAAYFADKHGLPVVSIRIGSVTETPADERRTHLWCSPRDLARLIVLSLNRSEREHRIVYGVSGSHEPFFDNGSAQALGYEPIDRAEAWDVPPDPEDPENWYVGGYFASRGMDSD